MRFAADENFDNDILRKLWRLYPDLDIVRVQDSEVAEATDDIVLEWAAREERILLTHDIRTMPSYVYARVAEGLPVPGVFEIPDTAPIGEVVETLVLIIEASDSAEWKDRATFIPFPRNLHTP